MKRYRLDLLPHAKYILSCTSSGAAHRGSALTCHLRRGGLAEALLGLAAKCAGRGAGEAEKRVEYEIAHVAAHRWGAAFPDDGAVAAAAASGKGCLLDAERRVVGCGDFCVSPKVEGAALSGAAAAARVAELIAETPAASL